MVVGRDAMSRAGQSNDELGAIASTGGTALMATGNPIAMGVGAGLMGLGLLSSIKESKKERWKKKLISFFDLECSFDC